MSNLNSDFNADFGWPDQSALWIDAPPADGLTLVEGDVTQINTNFLRPASVLRIVDDSLSTAPTLVLGDAGKAYEARGVLGGWATGGVAVGDVVEWDGTAWNIVVVQSGGDPPDGTRAVVVEASAAGSFAGDEEKTYACTSGTWAAVDTPADGELIDIIGANSIYYNRRYEYVGTHATGAWAEYGIATDGIVGFLEKLTSPVVANPKPTAWVVMQGTDQFDGGFVGKVTAAKLSSGVVFKIHCTAADTVAPGDYVKAVSGALVKCTGTDHALGQVDWSNATAGSEGRIVFTGV